MPIFPTIRGFIITTPTSASDNPADKIDKPKRDGFSTETIPFDLSNRPQPISQYRYPNPKQQLRPITFALFLRMCFHLAYDPATFTLEISKTDTQ